jgi:hypothetical protein
LTLSARVAARAFALAEVGLLPCFDLLKWESELLSYWKHLQPDTAVVAVNPLVALLPSSSKLTDSEAIGFLVQNSS